MRARRSQQIEIRRFLAAAVFASAFVLPLPVAAFADGAVILYRDEGFRGRSEAVRRDVPNLAHTRVGNDSVSSVRLAPGCAARLFSDVNFRGRMVEVTRDRWSLDGTTVGNDRVSSVQVRCGGFGGGYGDGLGRERGLAALYADEDFRGEQEWIAGDLPDLSTTRIGNDALSSLRVASGCAVRLYEDVGYRGEFAVLDGDVGSLADTPVGNDRASSLQVSCPDELGGPRGGVFERSIRGVTLYRDADYQGPSQTFDGNVSDLGGSSLGNDEASSVRVPPGCRVVLFENAGFRGDAIEIQRDVPDLERTRLGNDSVSSLRVDCW